jgi:HK97 family phage portal protein
MAVGGFLGRLWPFAGPTMPEVRADAGYIDLKNPAHYERIRGALYGGNLDASRNSAHLRCVTLISNALGMLPTNLQRLDADGNPAGVAKTHPVHRVLKVRPNHYQTPLVFKRAMTMQALQRGNAYALPIRVGGRVRELIPFPVGRVRTDQTDDLSVIHIATDKSGRETRYKAGEILHLMGPSENGVRGMSMLDAAKDTLDLWRDMSAAQKASYQQGANPGGTFSLGDGQVLTDEAHARLKAQLNDDHAGAENFGKWLLLEAGAKAHLFDRDLTKLAAVDAKNQSVEDIARIYGVPRPFLMLDDTSWGSGIEQLAIFFVQYALLPWFVAWEQAIALTLLTEAEAETLQVKFNEKALLRGTMKDQGEYLARLIGGTQAPALISQDEGRAILEMPPRGGDANDLFVPASGREPNP